MYPQAEQTYAMRSAFGTSFCGTGATVTLAPKGTSVPPRPDGEDGGAGRPCSVLVSCFARMLKLLTCGRPHTFMQSTLELEDTELMEADVRPESRDGARKLA